MPIEYHVDHDLGIVRHRFSDELALADFQLFWRELLTDPEVPDPLLMLADLRDCTFLIHGEDVHRIVATTIEPMIGDRRWLAAAVVADTTQFGVTMQFTAYSYDLGVTEIFHDIDTALAWLIETARKSSSAAA
jgi:hypothetical protein